MHDTDIYLYTAAAAAAAVTTQKTQNREEGVEIRPRPPLTLELRFIGIMFIIRQTQHMRRGRRPVARTSYCDCGDR